MWTKGLWGPAMYEIVIARDDESGKYYVHDSDIIGLNAIAASFDELIAVIEELAPQLIEANHKPEPSFLYGLMTALARRPEPKLHYNYTQALCLAS